MSAKSYVRAISRGVFALLCAIILFFLTPDQVLSLLMDYLRQAVISSQPRSPQPVPPTQTLRIEVVLPVRDQAGHHEFLLEVYDPSSPSYRQFLTVPESTGRSGPSQKDYDAVVDHLKSCGFKVTGGTRDAYGRPGRGVGRLHRSGFRRGHGCSPIL